MDWTWLLLIICPLMMGFMMINMKGMHGQSTHSKQSQSDWTLHEDYTELKVENERLKKEIQGLSK